MTTEYYHEKNHILAKLYYDIGKQATNFDLQHSHKQGEETIWTKRKSFLAINPIIDKYFIDNCNHRQILKNEIIFDFDRIIPKETALEDYDIKKLKEELLEDNYRFVIYHTGSKGIHLHIYWDGLILLTKNDREEFRKTLFRRYKWFSGVDLQKASDSSMIALEHTPHWKTGITKTMLYNNGVLSWK